MLKIGFVGWRGMVGSVLMARMREEQDFKGFEPVFFSTSNVGGQGPDVGMEIPPLKDAYDIELLTQLDIVVSCQGGDYTQRIHPELRKNGWKGYWIDSASTLRMVDESIIVLDPVNRAVIDAGLSSGVKIYVGGNCTVSLMLMALSGLFSEKVVEWISSMTYQAASGAGAKHMKELVSQMAFLGDAAKDLLEDPASTAVEIDALLTRELRSSAFPAEHFGVPLAASLIPWIDRPMETGQTREEWKGFAETNKILGTASDPIPVDGICVRVGAMRCHSQGFTIKLKRDIPLAELSDMVESANEWVRLVPNDKESTIRDLTPAAVSGTLNIAVGRLRKMNIGPDFITAFTCGDQLLWGAAEPIRRILNIVIEHLSS
ncbi:MAG: aspartate-semialdehyde dehydrogenase [Deltaproteobacteria bacterium]|nr:aspartate-semialdehyde dehydrogenase [Deltaproteobacteria bacterium]MBW2015325.1 aspartate-semialdehyde dehydrogenase [Deltaproteobacteria bacterium]MBW2128186.1 aspartate-semialdehyde dehydrogenase [Deltaproteobacteria bacterium]MBW2303097.1 aspartate-semialdehyde dehydrogenase [Deltaproteobacteria bacterium]